MTSSILRVTSKLPRSYSFCWKQKGFSKQHVCFEKFLFAAPNSVPSYCSLPIQFAHITAEPCFVFGARGLSTARSTTIRFLRDITFHKFFMVKLAFRPLLQSYDRDWTSLLKDSLPTVTPIKNNIYGWGEDLQLVHVEVVRVDCILPSYNCLAHGAGPPRYEGQNNAVRRWSDKTRIRSFQLELAALLYSVPH
jgi:hypothetical protein